MCSRLSKSKLSVEHVLKGFFVHRVKFSPIKALTISPSSIKKALKRSFVYGILFKCLWYIEDLQGRLSLNDLKIILV